MIHNLINRPQSTSLLLYDAIWYLACPARFERATYALEEIVAAGICNYFNELGHKKRGLCNKLCNAKVLLKVTLKRQTPAISDEGALLLMGP